MMFARLDVLSAFLMIFSTYSGFVRTQPHSKSRNVCVLLSLILLVASSIP